MLLEGLFEIELHVALVGLLFHAVFRVPLRLCETYACSSMRISRPIEVKAVGKEKVKVPPRLTSGEFFGSRLGQQLLRGQPSVWRENF